MEKSTLKIDQELHNDSIAYRIESESGQGSSTCTVEKVIIEDEPPIILTCSNELIAVVM